MKKRVITGVVWGLIGIGFLCFLFTPAVGLFVIMASVVADYELMDTFKQKNKLFVGVTMTVAGLVPIIVEYGAKYNFDLWGKIPVTPGIAILVYLGILLVIMLKNFETIKFEHVAVALYSSIIIPVSLSSIVLVRDFYKLFGTEVFTKTNCFYFVLSGLICAWFTDAFAYFTGSKLGKHKLAPRISPKKSVEGAIGGIVFTAILNIAVWAAFILLNKLQVINPLVIPFWVVPIMSMVLSVISMLGDLSASVIKRNCGVKDFGKFMGSHGGLMDRFDSYLFVMPSIYIMVYIITNCVR